MILIVAHSRLIDGKRDEFYKLAKELETKSRKEEGCVSYTLYEDLNDPLSFCFIEQWQDQAAIDLHNASTHFTHIVPLMNELKTESKVSKFGVA